jgi:hypothetical protein
MGHEAVAEIASLNGQVGEKIPNFRCANLGRMGHVMEVDVAFDPVDVGLLGATGVMLWADGITNLVEQLLEAGSIGFLR